MQISRKKLAIILVFVAIATILAASFMFKSNKSSVKDTVQLYSSAGDKFMEALAVNDAAATYEMMSPRLKEQIGSLDTWAKQLAASFGSSQPSFKLDKMSELPSLGNTYTEDDNPRRLQYAVSLKDKEYLMQLVLINQDGSIKVDEFNSMMK